MITTGAICIKTLLMENKKLQVLAISDNKINNEGVAAICQGLQNTTTLTELWMYDCGLSVEGIYYVHHHVASYSGKLSIICDLMMINSTMFCVQYNYSVCRLTESIM